MITQFPGQKFAQEYLVSDRDIFQLRPPRERLLDGALAQASDLSRFHQRSRTQHNGLQSDLCEDGSGK